jgi:hypothetical protein
MSTDSVATPPASPVPSAPPARSPDWDAVPHDVLCLLCRYNLRGLTEPRCPECGYRFDWQEVLDPTRHTHPYLFEHHPNPRGFVRTALGTVWPWTFWGNLNANQRPHRRRLVRYWMLSTASILVATVAVFVGLSYCEVNAALSIWGAPPGLGVWDAVVEQWHRFVQNGWWYRAVHVETPLVLLGAIVLWPWLSYLALRSLVASIKKAGVDRVHILRCVVYASDFGPWLTVALVAYAGHAVYEQWRARAGTPMAVDPWA